MMDNWQTETSPEERRAKWWVKVIRRVVIGVLVTIQLPAAVAWCATLSAWQACIVACFIVLGLGLMVLQWMLAP